MKAIIQTGYSYKDLQIAELDSEAMHPTSIEVETLLVPLLPYNLMKFSGDIPTTIPNVPGYGAVGIVRKVGRLRSQKLINKRVLVINPSGTFRQSILSNMPTLSVSIPNGVSSEQAAVVIGGMDTSYMLLKELNHMPDSKVILLGANSVIGLGLIQLLNLKGNVKIIPIVRPESKDYLDDFIKQNHLAVTSSQSAQLNDAIVIDIAGQESDVRRYVDDGHKVFSVVLPNTPGVQFVSHPLLPRDYIYLLDLISRKKLISTIDKIFNFQDIQQAVQYQQTNHSRGRNLISF